MPTHRLEAGSAPLLGHLHSTSPSQYLLDASEHFETVQIEREGHADCACCDCGECFPGIFKILIASCDAAGRMWYSPVRLEIAWLSPSQLQQTWST